MSANDMPQVGSERMEDAALMAADVARRIGDPQCAESWLKRFVDNKVASAAASIQRIAELGLPVDLLSTLLTQLAEYFSGQKAVETTIVQLGLFFERVRSPLALATLFERDPQALPILLRVFSLDGPLAKIVLDDVESFEALRVTQGRSLSKESLLTDLRSELEALEGDRSAAKVFQRSRDRERLRIGFGLLTDKISPETAGEQLAQLEEALIEAALELGRRRIGKLPADNGDLQMVVFGLGDLGAQTTHFESTSELLILHNQVGVPSDSAAREEAADRTARTALGFIQSLGTQTVMSVNPLIDPQGVHGLCAPAQAAFRELDQFGRTWQRLKMMQARVVAGAESLGISFLTQLEPWLFRRRLTDADIDGLHFQYRRWRREALHDNLDNLVRGIRILQLTLSGDHLGLRVTSLFAAILKLAETRAISPNEAETLHAEIRELTRDRLLSQLGVHCNVDANTQKFASARGKIGSALQKVFGDTPDPDPITDLVMDPLPEHQNAELVFAPMGFENSSAAAAALAQLAQESSPFLSTRKSRHFLARIAPAMVRAIAKTPSPDHTLSVLSRVADSLGAKGALWELFLANPPSMELCIRICAYSPYLASILIASPGFIDELLDSLQLARLPSLAAMESRLDDLCKGAELDQAIHEFKNALHLRVGVRDILGKERITSMHQSLAQTAEAIIRRVVADQFKELSLKHGVPTIDTLSGERDCQYVLLLAGKVGALEPNYHSELDVAVIYEADGMTKSESRGIAAVSCAHFFSQLTQRSIRRLTSRGKLGQLYSVNNNLRPLGAQGPLAVSLEALRHHYLDGPRPWSDLLWLCKARPAGGEATLAARAMEILREAICNTKLTKADVGEFREFRVQQALGANPLNLKRATGGTQHIELLVQFLQLRYVARFPRILTPGTSDAITRLSADGLLEPSESEALFGAYQFLRSLESRIRLMNTLARHDLPENQAELRSLASFIGVDSAELLREQCFAKMRDANAVIEAREERLAKEAAD
jgi:glutamate-ammonia-ligase adenylyltransferase